MSAENKRGQPRRPSQKDILAYRLIHKPLRALRSAAEHLISGQISRADVGKGAIQVGTATIVTGGYIAANTTDVQGQIVRPDTRVRQGSEIEFPPADGESADVQTPESQQSTEAAVPGAANPETPSEQGFKIAFGPEYDGKNSQREAEAQKLLNSIWQSAQGRSKTLKDRADFFIRNTDISPQKFDDVKTRINGKVETVSITQLEVRAPALETLDPARVNIEMPVSLRVGVYPTTLTRENGEIRDIAMVDVILLVGKTDYKLDANQIEGYAQFLLFPNALAVMTNLEIRELVRQGITVPEELKTTIGDSDSDFYKRVRVRAWNRMFMDTRNIFREAPDTWNQQNTVYMRNYRGWLAAGQTDEARFKYIEYAIVR